MRFCNLRTNATTSNNKPYFTRIGLRYIDAFNYKVYNLTDSTLREYFNHAVLGCFSDDKLSNNIRSLQHLFELNIENILSKLHLSCDADSCIIEWNFKTFRIGFSFEENEIESSYYLVESNIENGEFVSYSKLLKDTSFYVLIDKILSYVISNT